MDNGFIVINAVLKDGDCIEYSFAQSIRIEQMINKNNINGYHTFRHGPLVLGISNLREAVISPEIDKLAYTGSGSYQIKNTALTLSPINDMYLKSEDDALNDIRQVLFK